MSKPVCLISACRLGYRCRYHGRIVGSPALVARLQTRYKLVPVCPELLAGLPVPRAPAFLDRDGRVRLGHRSGRLDVFGRLARLLTEYAGTNDVTPIYAAGASMAWLAAQLRGAVAVCLVPGSPSCDPERGLFARLCREGGLAILAH